MTDATTISVRGEARRVVPPDLAVVATAVRLRNRDKQAALDRGAAMQDDVLEVLRERGGQSLTVESVDAALTWSTTSFSADRVRRRADPRRGVVDFDGWRVYVPIMVTLRNLAQLEDIARALAAVRQLRIQQVSWGVDRRNPAWPAVRAAAIADAVAKARDYAGALGGTVTALVHVADAGLLGGRDHYSEQQSFRLSGLGFSKRGEGRTPTLDPAPQEISAVIEARFEATVDPL
jgi:uncharacterized protein YggE